MDILGIGGWELVAILVIMLVVAGPKRMIAWSYTLGKYVAALRDMWAETAKALQREFDQAGVDIQVPKDIPTRGTIHRELGRVMNQASKPLRDPLKDARDELRDATGNGAAKNGAAVIQERTPPDSSTPGTAPRPVNGTRPPSPRPMPRSTPTSAVPPAVPDDGNDLGTWSS